MAAMENIRSNEADLRLNQYRRGAYAIFCAKNRAIGRDLATPRSYEMLAKQVRDCCAEDVQLVVEEQALWNRLLMSCGRVDRRETTWSSTRKQKVYQVVYSTNIDSIAPLNPKVVDDIIDTWWEKRSPSKRSVGGVCSGPKYAEKRQRAGGGSVDEVAQEHPSGGGTAQSLAGFSVRSEVLDNAGSLAGGGPQAEASPTSRGDGRFARAETSAVDVNAPSSGSSGTPLGAFENMFSAADNEHGFFHEHTLFATSFLVQWRRLSREDQTAAMSSIFDQLVEEEQARVLAAWSRQRAALFTDYISAATGSFDEQGLGGPEGVRRCSSFCPTLFRLLKHVATSEHQSQHGNRNEHVVDACILAVIDILGHCKQYGQVSFPTVARTGFLLKWGGTSRDVHGIFSRLRLACSETTAAKMIDTAAARHLQLAERQVEEWRLGGLVPVIGVDNWNPLSWPIDLERCAAVLRSYDTWRLPRDTQLPRDTDGHVTPHTFTFLPSLDVSSSTFTDHVQMITGSLLGKVFRCDSQEVVVLADPEPLLKNIIFPVPERTWVSFREI